MSEHDTQGRAGDGERLHLWYVDEEGGEWGDISHVAVAQTGEEALRVVRETVECEGGLDVSGHIADDAAWPVCYPDDEPAGDYLPDGASTTRDPAGRLIVHATAGAWAAYYGRAVYLGSTEDV